MGSSDDAPVNRTVIAVDKDKHSQFAVRWAVEHLALPNTTITLVHVKLKNQVGGGDGGVSALEEAQQIFVPCRGFCARKSIHVKEVALEDVDVAKALVDYISTNFISNIVLGTSSRNSLLKTFKKPDVPSVVTKHAPDFCSVYVIAKSKALTIRSAQRPIANTAAPPKLPSGPSVFPEHTHQQDSPRTDKLSMDRTGIDCARRAARLRAPQVCSFRNLSNRSMESFEISATSSSRISNVDDEILDPLDMFNSIDISNKNYDFSFVGESRRDDHNSPSAAHDLEAEMKRLKLELKQTMDMYSTACKEAITAKQKAKELNEQKEVEQMRPPMAIVEMEKAKCKAAMEAAEAAQRLAEKEVQKRMAVEMKLKQESEENDRSLVPQHDARYRRYSIQDIEVATENFSEKLKIGEGGYGPVYRAKLDHTPVAIKVLRSDAAQGKRQFQQEVEILSSMRHPNMVLLLGACPEYGCLVYEHMNYGSLEDRLNRKGGTPPIPWRIRFRIAAEIGTSLTFLHQAKPEPLVHRDLKPDNILLDRNFVSKIADVGLARLVPPSVADSVTQYHMTSAAGTFCYIDPEYQQSGMLTTKSDVYSFGVVLLQIITARPPMGLTHQAQRAIDQGKFGEFLDPSVTDWPIDEALALAKLALKCCELRKRDRPDLAKVILPELIRLRELGEDENDNFFFNRGPYQPTRNLVASRPRLPSSNNQS